MNLRSVSFLVWLCLFQWPALAVAAPAASPTATGKPAAAGTGAAAAQPATPAGPTATPPAAAPPSPAATGPAAAPAGPLQLVSDVWPPFTDVEGKPRQAIELVQAALRRAGHQSTFVILNWSAAMPLLEKAHYAGSAALWKSPEREKFMIFSKPYLENRLVLVGRVGTDVSATSFAALAGKRLALTRGYAYGDAATKTPKVQIVLRDNDADCMRALLSKQADYLLMDELMVDHLFRRYRAKAEKLIVVGRVPLVQNSLHFALHKSYPGAQQIIDDFDRNIGKMVADGTYNDLLDVPWIRVDVDHDGRAEYVASSHAASQGDGDPHTRGGYPVFTPDMRPAGKGAPSPTYVIDGKSYNNWGDAATTLQRDTSAPSAAAYKYSTGFVLGEF
jgi:polar amino acid transport system substrate-binding protein